MIINILNKYQARFYFSKVEKRHGICSKHSENEKHMLLWDFDNTDLENILQDLRYLIARYALPNVYVLQTSKSGYHAYCFSARPFKEVIHILSDTNSIDMHYLRLGMVRGYYTLRFSARQDGSPKLIKILESVYPAEMSPLDMTVNEYFTTNRGFKIGKT